MTIIGNKIKHQCASILFQVRLIALLIKGKGEVLQHQDNMYRKEAHVEWTVTGNGDIIPH